MLSHGSPSDLLIFFDLLPRPRSVGHSSIRRPHASSAARSAQAPLRAFLWSTCQRVGDSPRASHLLFGARYQARCSWIGSTPTHPLLISCRQPTGGFGRSIAESPRVFTTGLPLARTLS